MRYSLFIAAFVAAVPVFADDPKLIDAPKPPDGFPRFKVQEIDTGLKIGYAVITTDIDGDTKPDIVVVDQHNVVWYQNPTWKKRVILDGKTKPDNVCITALDIDGDKLPELVLGAGWKPADTKTPGTLQWLKRGKTLDDEWTMHPIPCDEPTVHRVRVGDIDLDGKPEIVMAPLHGRDATAKGNWTDGRPVRIQVYRVPEKEPEKKESWKSKQLVDDAYELRVVHNFDIDPEVKSLDPAGAGKFFPDFKAQKPCRFVYVGSSNGVLELWRFADDKLNKEIPVVNVAAGYPSTGKNRPQYPSTGKNRPQAVSEVRTGYANTANMLTHFTATVEPWHGNKLVVYPPSGAAAGRVVLDDHLRWGHAIQCAALTDEKTDFIVLGVRDNPQPTDKFKEKRGVRIYRNTDGKGEKWDRYILEDGGVAVEDLTVSDLNADGKPDIVAVGRATGNARIYWNQGK